MWDESDLTGGATDAEETIAKQEGKV